MANPERRPSSSEARREMYKPAPRPEVSRPTPEQQKSAKERRETAEAVNELAESLSESAKEKVQAYMSRLEGGERDQVMELVGQFEDLQAQRSDEGFSAMDYAKSKRDIFVKMNVVLDRARDRILDEEEAALAETDQPAPAREAAPQQREMYRPDSAEDEAAAAEDEDSVFVQDMSAVEAQRAESAQEEATEKAESVEVPPEWQKWLDDNEAILIRDGAISETGFVTNKQTLLEKTGLTEDNFEWIEAALADRETTLQSQADMIMKEAVGKGFIDKNLNVWTGSPQEVMDEYDLSESAYNAVMKRVSQKLDRRSEAA